MTDGVIKSTGNSRYLKSVANLLSLAPTWPDAVELLVSGNFPVDFNGINPNGWNTQGTPLNKANLLSDATGTLLGLGSTGTVNAALAALKTSLNAFPAASKVAAIETGTAYASNDNFSITATNTIVCILLICNAENAVGTGSDVPAIGIVGKSYGVLSELNSFTNNAYIRDLTVSVSGKTWKISQNGAFKKRFTYFALTKK